MNYKTPQKSERVLELIELLQLKSRTTKELSEHFDVPPRTIQRDLKTIKKLGHNPATEIKGTHYINPKASHLNAVEALATHAATRLLFHHTQTRNRYFQKALEKLALTIPEPARAIAVLSAEEIQSRVVDDRSLELAALAWFENKILKFDYTADVK